MNAAVKTWNLKSLTLIAAIAGLATLASSATAAPPTAQLRLYPGGGNPQLVQPQIPRLGFYGHCQWNAGMVVDAVPFGSIAKRIGLESGDVIVAVNGNWLRSQNDYYRALQYSGGYVQLTVQDIRSGRLYTRVAVLDGYGNNGPIAYGAPPNIPSQLQ